jgi:hypothetical protein
MEKALTPVNIIDFSQRIDDFTKGLFAFSEKQREKVDTDVRLRQISRRILYDYQPQHERGLRSAPAEIQHNEAEIGRAHV